MGGQNLESATAMEAALAGTREAAAGMSQTALEAAGVAQPSEKRKKAQREKPFHVHFQSADGAVYDGDFTNKILSLGQRSVVGALQAKFADGVPYETLDYDTRRLNEMVAHLSVSLVRRPDWFKDIAGIYDVDLLQVVYAEVLTHEAEFRVPE